jgi:hypothetical protein
MLPKYDISGTRFVELEILNRKVGFMNSHSVQTEVHSKHNSYFIEIVKLHVLILYTDHHQALK